MEHFKSAFEILISQVRRTGSFYKTIFALFLYHFLFDDLLKCSCEYYVSQEMSIFYMVFPALILFLFTLWMDAEFQRVLRITCRCRCQCSLILRLLKILIKAAAIGMLWVVSVLIDGDWYVCLEMPTSFCRNTTDTTHFESWQFETHKNWESKVFASGLILVLLVGNFILTAIPWRNCCYRRCMDIKPYYRALFEENIWEETEIHIEKVLKKTAQEYVVHCSKEVLPRLSNPAPTTITTITVLGEGEPTSTTTHGGGTSSSTNQQQNPTETLNAFDFDKISDLYPDIMTNLFSASNNQSTDIPLN